MRVGLLMHLLAAAVLCILAATSVSACVTPMPLITSEVESMEKTPMSLNSDTILSAQVALPPASGKPIDEKTVITSDNIQEYLPAQETVEQTRQAFEAAGFDVGEVVGTSFSITAPASTFQQVFQTELVANEESGVYAVQADGSESYELDLSTLPAPLMDSVVTVTFSPPPDFGPSDFMGP